jgi:hypothetical protein
MISKTISSPTTSSVILVKFNSWLWLVSLQSWDEVVRGLIQISSFHAKSQGTDFIILSGKYISIILKLRLHLELFKLSFLFPYLFWAIVSTFLV